jgi:hypothetical protein
MEIPASTPVETQPVEAKVYDKWVIDRLHFNGDGISQPLRADVLFKLARKTDGGEWEFHPDIVRNLYVSDIWSKVADDAEMASVMQSMLALLTRLGTEAGVL